MSSADNLLQTFSEHPLGLCGMHDPAKAVDVIPDIEPRLSALTLGTVLDINPITRQRWERITELAGHWLLNPSIVAYKSSHEVQHAMLHEQLSGPAHIARVWWQLCRAAQGRFYGNWGGLFTACEFQAQRVQEYLLKSKTTFPVLAGPVISARWLDLVHRRGKISLLDWENIRIEIPSNLKTPAQQFEISENTVHPFLFSALKTWVSSCKQMSEKECGLVGCPRLAK
ncbi:MAG: hypothetical protein R6W69_13075 [Anaerolineales bacterium]